MTGCKDLTGNPALPAGTPDPVFYHTAAGALGMRTAAVAQLEQALPQYVTDAGLLTDELEDFQTGASQGVLNENNGQITDPLDERILPPTVTVKSYGQLQAVRSFSNQALGALAAYDTVPGARDSATVLRAELYAFEGYAEILLADLFCSGVPLSTLDFRQDYTYEPGSTTQQVYQNAIAKFDTALVLGAASDSVVQFARIGRGRAYIDLGQFDSAAAAVANVPDGFRYQVSANWGNNAVNLSGFLITLTSAATLSDREGQNGLPYRSSGDPRTADTVVCIPNPSNPNSCNKALDTLWFPRKYVAAYHSAIPGYAPFTLASGIEARLIQAEAALHANNNSWLAILNTLRTENGLGTISDPVDPVARIDTLFTERAFWLYLDGHRQGDLRRLLRQYGSQYPAFSDQSLVYPTGLYRAPGTGLYGTSVVAPVPSTEAANPLFHGCLSYAP